MSKIFKKIDMTNTSCRFNKHKKWKDYLKNMTKEIDPIKQETRFGFEKFEERD